MSRYYNSVRVKNQAAQFKELEYKIQRGLEQSNPRREAEQRETLYSSSMPQILKEVKEFAKKWGKTVDDVSLDHYYYNDYGSDTSGLDMTVNAPETDEQYHSRLWEAHERECLQNERDRVEFERLKKKFEQ